MSVPSKFLIFIPVALLFTLFGIATFETNKLKAFVADAVYSKIVIGRIGMHYAFQNSVVEEQRNKYGNLILGDSNFFSGIFNMRRMPAALWHFGDKLQKFIGLPGCEFIHFSSFESKLTINETKT